jgi:hypothetical protein
MLYKAARHLHISHDLQLSAKRPRQALKQPPWTAAANLHSIHLTAPAATAALDCGSLLPPSSRSLLRWQKAPLHPQPPNHRIADQSRHRNSRVIHASRAGSGKRQQGCRSPCGEACRAGATHLHDRGFRTMATSLMPPPLRHCHDSCHPIQRAFGVTVTAHLSCQEICRSCHKTDRIRGDLRGATLSSFCTPFSRG